MTKAGLDQKNLQILILSLKKKAKNKFKKQLEKSAFNKYLLTKLFNQINFNLIWDCIFVVEDFLKDSNRNCKTKFKGKSRITILKIIAIFVRPAMRIYISSTCETVLVWNEWMKSRIN